MKISRKWGVVFFYTAGIFVVTPFLPQLIRFASSQWSRSGVSNFVLGVEIIIALLILGAAIRFLIYRKKKSIIFFIFIGGIRINYELFNNVAILDRVYRRYFRRLYRWVFCGSSLLHKRTSKQV